MSFDCHLTSALARPRASRHPVLACPHSPPALATLSACAAATVTGHKILQAIGVHLGLLLQLLFTSVFARQAFKSFGVPEKRDRFPLFVVMAVGSALALALMRLLKPKDKKR